MSTLRRKNPGDLGRKPQRDLYVLQEAVSTEAAKTEKYHAVEAPAGGRGMKERIYGIDCDVTQEQLPDGKHPVYRFTVPGWPECKVTGKRAAKRVIHGRLDPAVRNTLGIKWTPEGEEDT